MEHSRVVAAQDQVSCDLDGEAVVLNLKSGVYHGLNLVAAEVWKWVQEPRTFAEVRDMMMEGYEVELARCETDLRKLLGDLADRGLVEISDEAPA